MVPLLGSFLHSPSAEEHSPSSWHSDHHPHTQPCSLFLSFLSNSPVFPVFRKDRREETPPGSAAAAKSSAWEMGFGTRLRMNSRLLTRQQWAVLLLQVRPLKQFVFHYSNIPTHIKPSLNPYNECNEPLKGTRCVPTRSELLLCLFVRGNTEKLYELMCLELGNSVT